MANTIRVFAQWQGPHSDSVLGSLPLIWRFPNHTIDINFRNIICPLDVFNPEIDVECAFGQLLSSVGVSYARDIKRTVASKLAPTEDIGLEMLSYRNDIFIVTQFAHTYHPRQIPNAYLALIHGTKEHFSYSEIP